MYYSISKGFENFANNECSKLYNSAKYNLYHLLLKTSPVAKGISDVQETFVIFG